MTGQRCDQCGETVIRRTRWQVPRIESDAFDNLYTVPGAVVSLWLCDRCAGPNPPRPAERPVVHDGGA
ncbi:MAG: hypothetical protein OXK73_03290 [Rhodospirillaceae bacterium]|nr:hypothetical protein [Rhodospirillaceae bacterium]MDE0416430.1 hypothetical protein [bacterium]